MFRDVVTLALLLASGTLAAEPPDARLEAIAAIHGEAGPWAAAGYRMATFALEKLGVTAGKGDLIVEHRSPGAVQFTCVADGAQAATKVSVGKRSLSWVEVPLDKMETVFTRPSTGARVVLRPSKRFVEAFLNAPREKAHENAKKVFALPDADVFEIVSGPTAPRGP
jgi:formylmethanofuran dehydrogenase subunit E